MRRLTLILLLLTACIASAQCPLRNTAFQSGETLEYKLYFNWKFVWINAGTATMHIQQTQHQGKSAYKTHLITSTSKRLDKFFMMRDTLEGYVTTDLIPLYFKKSAREGGKYRVDEVSYDYPAGRCRLHQRYQNSHGEITERQHESDECIYDMVSMMCRARSLRESDYQVGARIPFLLADGKDVDHEALIYRGKKNFTTEDTKITYRCLVISFVERQGKKDKEIITFYVTDDDNHLPVRLDMFLRFGVAKAYLRTSSGVRNPQTSIVKDRKTR